jgi:hypothetical protein
MTASVTTTTTTTTTKPSFLLKRQQIRTVTDGFQNKTRTRARSKTHQKNKTTNYKKIFKQ